MLMNPNSTMLGLMALAVGLSFVLTAAARVIAHRIGLIDKPDGQRKSHKEPTPLMGGVSLFCSLLGTIAAAKWVGLEWLDGAGAASRLVPMLLVSGGLFCAVGYWDDKHALRPRTKLLLQIAACLPFVIWGRSVDSVQLMGASIDLGIFGVVFTVFWLVACANVINLVDGLDGLAGTIGVIVCLAVAALSEMRSLMDVTALALIFAACLVGFLLHNWPPAKIFLGDSGSLLIGFVIGALSIESSLKTATSFALGVPLVLMSVPIFATTMAIVRRKLSGKGIGEADRGHIHHCLQDRGLSRARSLLVISALCIAMAAVTLVSAYFQNDVLALGLCVSLLVFLIIGRVFGYNETLLFFRFTQAMSHMLVDSSRVLSTRLVVARMNEGEHRDPLDSWNQITRHVKKMGGTRLEFVYWDEQTDEVVTQLSWTNQRETSADESYWQFSYSVPNEQGVRASLIASGQSQKKMKGRRLIDLFRVFDTVCRSWSDERARQMASAEMPESAVIPLQASPMRIVPGTSTSDAIDDRKAA